MQALVNSPTNFSSLNFHNKHNDTHKTHSGCYKLKCSQPLFYHTSSAQKIESFRRKKFKTEALREISQFSGVGRAKNGILWGERKRVVFVECNKGFFNGLGGGNGKINSENSRVLGNLALAILLTYLTMNGQLGWLLDAIVSLWLIAVLVPIVGVGAFLWWAGRDVVQSSCPNCGNDFKAFKSILNEDVQLCPFCSQPFAVEGDKFVSEPVKFSNQSTAFDQTFSGFSPLKKKGKGSSTVAVVDVEAEIRDAE